MAVAFALWWGCCTADTNRTHSIYLLFIYFSFFPRFTRIGRDAVWKKNVLRSIEDAERRKKNSWIAHTPYTLHTERVKKTAQIIKDHISLFACSDIATVRVLYTCICMCCTVSLVKITLFSFKSGKKTTLKTGKKSIRHALIQMSAIPFNRWSLFFFSSLVLSSRMKTI